MGKGEKRRELERGIGKSEKWRESARERENKEVKLVGGMGNGEQTEVHM